MSDEGLAVEIMKQILESSKRILNRFDDVCKNEIPKLKKTATRIIVDLQGN